MGIGLLVFLLSWRFLYHFTETTGQVCAFQVTRHSQSHYFAHWFQPNFSLLPRPFLQILGGVLMLSGAVGWVGGQRRSANIVNLQLVASLVGILLAFSFVSEVGGAGRVLEGENGIHRGPIMSHRTGV